MTKQIKKSKSSRAGAKALIIIATVGGTIGGWAAFAGTTPASDIKVAALPAQVMPQPVAQPIVIPTLVPIDDAIAASRKVEGLPQVQARPQPQVLRSVIVPQMPMARSRSSR